MQCLCDIVNQYHVPSKETFSHYQDLMKKPEYKDDWRQAVKATEAFMKERYKIK
jgi:hypothetical protein